MTGFIRGLFGGGKEQPKQAKGAFFLEPDEAKTLGDIDFMRQPKVIKRTYAKKQGEEEKEIATQVSSMSKSKLEEPRGISTPSTSSTQSSSFGQSNFGKTESSTPRRSSGADSGMDMFRKMAKDVKKR